MWLLEVYLSGGIPDPPSPERCQKIVEINNIIWQHRVITKGTGVENPSPVIQGEQRHLGDWPIGISVEDGEGDK